MRRKERDHLIEVRNKDDKHYLPKRVLFSNVFEGCPKQWVLIKIMLTVNSFKVMGIKRMQNCQLSSGDGNHSEEARHGGQT